MILTWSILIKVFLERMFPACPENLKYVDTEFKKMWKKQIILVEIISLQIPIYFKLNFIKNKTRCLNCRDRGWNVWILEYLTRLWDTSELWGKFLFSWRNRLWEKRNVYQSNSRIFDKFSFLGFIRFSTWE